MGNASNQTDVFHTQWRKLYRGARLIRQSISRRFNTPVAEVEYDRQTVRIMRRVLNKDTNAIDIGAAWGELLTPIVKYAPLGHHRAVEPQPQFAVSLRKTFPNVEVHEVALSDHNGEAEFFVVPDSPGYSGLLRSARSLDMETFTVQIRKLDDLIALDDPVGFIKIDVEGAELNVLRGGRACLRRHHPVIVFEYSGEVPEFGVRTWDVYDFLTELGYGIFTLEQWLRPGAAPLDRSEFPPRRRDAGWHWMYIAESRSC